jgi:hypothetical protein
MLNQFVRVAFLAVLLCCPVLALAQEEEEGIALQSGTVHRMTRVRRKPSVRQRALTVLQPNSKVRIISPETRRGFYRVILEKGRQGYVRARDIRLERPLFPIENVNKILAERTNPPCIDELRDCENIGCAEPNSSHAIFNQAKRRVPSGTASRLLTFADFRSLQTQTDEVVEQGSQLEERNSLQGFTISSGTVGEGSLVKLVGFIATGADPHANTGESVNCRLPRVENNDIHISLALRAAHTEFQGIVVEMIPQDRSSSWTIAKLKKIKRDGLRVMVMGGLFYDNLHVVNEDPSDPLRGQPKRFSLWEVHPITRFFVCERANNACGPTNLNQWTKLEDFQLN